MPHLFPNLSDLTEADLNEQRAAFVAVLADQGHLGRLWGNHTTGIMGFAQTMGEQGDEFDAEIRGEFCQIMYNQAEWLRMMNDQIQTAAMFLSGVPLTRYVRPVNLRQVMEKATSYQWTAWAGKPPTISWNESNPIVADAEGHVFFMLLALVRHGLRLAQHLEITVTRSGEQGKQMDIFFTGKTDPQNFTDPETWFTIDSKRGSDSILLFVASKLAKLSGGKIWIKTANKSAFDFRLRFPDALPAGADIDTDAPYD